MTWPKSTTPRTIDPPISATVISPTTTMPPMSNSVKLIASISRRASRSTRSTSSASATEPSRLQPSVWSDVSIRTGTGSPSLSAASRNATSGRSNGNAVAPPVVSTVVDRVDELLGLEVEAHRRLPRRGDRDLQRRLEPAGVGVGQGAPGQRPE